MKRTFLAAAVALVVATPAFAQSSDPDLGTGNLESWPYTSNPYADRAQASPYGAYGFVPYHDAYGFDPYTGAAIPAPNVRHRHGRRIR